MAESVAPDCIFCRIATGLPAKAGSAETRLLFESDSMAAFKDIRPATEHHYLVIPKKHVGNPKSLTTEHLELLQEMKETADRVLTERGVSLTDDSCLFGYHWPPFNSVQHLHLHAIGDRGSMGFMARMIHRPDSFWFITHQSLVERLGASSSEST